MKFIAISGGGSVLLVNLDAIATMRFDVDRAGTSTSAELISVGGQITRLASAQAAQLTRQLKLLSPGEKPRRGSYS